MQSESSNLTQSAAAPKSRHTWIDALRLLAGLSMVGLHATADANGQPFPDWPAEDRVIPMLLRAVLYTARTELFLMISIFLLFLSLSVRPRPYAHVIGEQAKRLLVPFLFWTAFYALYNLIKADSFGYLVSEVSRISSPQAWVGFLSLGTVKYHMHFIPTLFGLVLLYPLYRKAYDHPVLGLSILGFLLIKRELDGIIYAQFWGHDLLPFLVRAVKIATYAGYGMAAAAFAGLWQKHAQARLRLWFLPALTLGAFLFYFKLLASWQTIETGTWPFDYTPGYWADFLMPAVLMLICMSLAHRAWPAALSRAARYSFGIYLCHPIFLDLAEITLRHSHFTPLTQILLEITWTIPLTAGFVWLLSRSSHLGWTIGLGPLPSPSRAFRHLDAVMKRKPKC